MAALHSTTFLRGAAAAALRNATCLAPPRVLPVAGMARNSLLAPSLVLGHSRQPFSATTLAAAMVDAPPAASSFASIMDDETDESDDMPEVVKVDAALQDESLKVENLGLSPETVAAMHKRGVAALFPIQKSVFAPIAEGRDIIGRAKTGSGKTLAFALPVVEGILAENRAAKAAGGTPRVLRGRTPRAIVMAPTRELANQVAKEFATVCPSLGVTPVYGGVPIGGHIRDLERGTDVVVGTPGRIMDLIDRGALVLDKVRYAVLDEADQMLDMGFEEDMEQILSYVPQERQTLLFSATLPKWVNKVARRFQTNPLLVDLVGEDNTGKLADTIKVLLMQVDWQQKLNALTDAINMHASGGKAMVFVNTKVRADEICEAVGRSLPTVALHGDISQQMRDRGLQQFRDGKYAVLVATDVAARGLDIPNVDLVVHYDVPQDNESFLHRSGRTGRAGKQGTAMVLFSDKEVRSVGLILNQCKVESAELVGPPEPGLVLSRASKGVLGQLDRVDPDVINFFVPAAEKLLASEQPSRVLAAALASLAGFQRAPQPRSLLTYEEGAQTLRIMGPPGGIDGFRSLATMLGSLAAKAKLPNAGQLEYALGKIQVVEDRDRGLGGVAFDLPAAEAAMLLNNKQVQSVAAKQGYAIDKPNALPLDIRSMMNSGAGGSRGGSSYGRGGSRGGGGGGFRGGYDNNRSGAGGSRFSGRDNRQGGYGQGGRDSSSRGGGYGGGGGARGGDWGSRGSTSGGRSSSSSRSNSRSSGDWSAGDDGNYFTSSGAGYTRRAGGAGGGAGGAASSSRAPPRSSAWGSSSSAPNSAPRMAPPNDGDWAQW